MAPFRYLAKTSDSHALVDCTFGCGGHTGALVSALAGLDTPIRHGVIAFDQDENAIERGRVRFKKETEEGRLRLVHRPFSEAADELEGRKVFGLLADLGFSSDQLEDPTRGLSFMREGPLDMRLDPRRGESAYNFLAHATEKEIADVLFELGEERLSRMIASSIVRTRSEKKLPDTTTAFADLVSRCFPPAARHGRIHPATRTFQALRIYVNRELEELDTLLKEVVPLVVPGGRVAIISFHSLEDRKVKQLFKDRDGPYRQLTKKPIEADDEELGRNPRSRSAKLRIAERKLPEVKT